MTDLPLSLGERIMRPLLLVSCALLFLAIPLKIISYGYLPPDDALRHAAFAVDHRHWNEVLVFNPELRSELDCHPGWHLFLRYIHQHLGLDQEGLAEFSIILAFLTFTCGGLIASGNPLAWLSAFALVAFTEYGMFQRLSLGRPTFLSMSTLVVLLFMWSRPKPLRIWQEMLIAIAMLTVSFCMHPTVWYLWSMLGLALVLCKRWRAVFVLGISIVCSLCLAALIVGSWYNVLVASLLMLRYSLLQDPLVGTNLVSELQPSGGPIVGLLVVLSILFIKGLKGQNIRDEFSKESFVLMLLTWVLGMKIVRFWLEWGLPAMSVWLCLQIKDLLKIKLSGLARVRDTLWLAGFLAGGLYLGITADLMGRYTNNLKSPLLTKPVSDYAGELPEEGGVLYSTDMTIFYKIYFRIPNVKFRFSTGYELGFMPPEDLKIFRAIQFNDNLLESYKPWFEKMTPKDRIIIQVIMKPEWQGMEFKRFYTAWIGRKIEKAGDKDAPANSMAPEPKKEASKP